MGRGKQIYIAASAVSAALSAYHGYKRSGSMAVALGWGAAGALLPGVAPAYAIYQGFGRKREDLQALPPAVGPETPEQPAQTQIQEQPSKPIVQAEPPAAPEPPRIILPSFASPTRPVLRPDVGVQVLAREIPAQAQALDERIQARGFPNASIGIVYDGNLFWHRGYGTIATDSSNIVMPNTLYRIASLTKPLTALAILSLRDEGKLQLDQPVTEFLPEVNGLTPAPGTRGPITLRHLLSHTSGLPRNGRMVYWTSRAPTDQEVLDGLLGLQLESAPGQTTSYSNLGFALLGIVIRRVSGMPYEAFMAKRVLGPLGMTWSGFATSAVPQDRMAVGWVRKDDKFSRPKGLWAMGTANAGGGLWSSVEDMAKFAAYEMDAYDPSKPWPNVATRSSVVESHRDAGFAPDSKTRFGVSWGVVTDAVAGVVVSHTGKLQAYTSVIWVAPIQRFSVIALAGSDDSEGLVQAVAPLFWNLLHDLVRPAVA